MRIRRVAFVASLVVAFSVGLTATRAEPTEGFRLESRVPASTLVFASLEGMGRLQERMESTAIGKFLAEPEVEAFLEPIEEGLRGLLEGRGGRGRSPLSGMPPIVLEALGHIGSLQGQVALALLDVDAERGVPQAVASLDFGGNVNAFVEFLGKLQKEIDPQGQHVKTTMTDGRATWTMDADGVTIAATIVDTAFVVATGETLLRQTVAGGAEGNLGASEEFLSVRRRTAGDQPLAFVYGNVEAGLSKFGSHIPSEVRPWVTALGLDTVKSAAYGCSFSGDGFVDSVSVHAPGADHGLVALLKMEPLGDGRFLRSVPANAFFYEETTFDLSTYLPRLRAMLASADPDTVREMDGGIAEIGRALGVDLEKDVLGSLAPGMGVYASLPETGGLFPEVVLMLRTKDPAATEKAFEALTAGIAGMVNEEGRLIAGVRTIEYRGQRLHLFEIQKARGDDVVPFTPTWTLVGDALVITLVPHTMKEVVLRAAETPSGGLAAQEDFQALWKLKPADAGAVGYVDLQAGLALLYDTLVPLLQTAAKPNVTKDVPFRLDWAQLPAARTVRKHFRSIAFYETVNDDGISFSLHAPVPLVPVLVAAGAAAALSMGRGGFDRHPVDAPYARAEAVRPTGALAVTESQARAVEQAVHMYYLVNHKLPASLQDLTRPDQDGGEPYLESLPQDGWGNDFQYRATGESTFEVVSGGPDGMMGTGDDVTWPKPKDEGGRGGR